MIAPSATDLQITWRVSLAPETLPTKQRDRGFVVRLNVCLEAVKAEFPEGASNDEPQGFAHIPAVRIRDESVAADICALEKTSHDFGEVDDPNKHARGAQHDKMPLMRRRA